MLKKIQLIAILFSMILFSQCRKIKIVPDVEGTPVFFVSLSIGGTDSLQFTAGKDDYALFTSYQQGADSIYAFVGEFKKEDGTSSSPSLRFEIRDREANPVTVDVEQALSLSSYSFFVDNIIGELDTIYEARFSILPLPPNCVLNNIAPEAFDWDFGDGTYSTGYSPSHIYENTGDKTVRLVANYDGDLQAISEQKMSFDTGFTSCSANIETELVQNGLFLQLSAISIGGIPPYSYSWANDTMPLSDIFIPLPLDSLSQFYSVTITDSQGCQAVMSGTIPIENPVDICSPVFDYSTEIRTDTIASNDVQFSTITIIYTDSDGYEYRSDIQAQNNAFFTIQNVDDFANNENGEKTKKINIDFACELFSREGLPGINISSTGAVIGVAYPE